MFFEHLSPYNDSDTGLDSGSVLSPSSDHTNREEDTMSHLEEPIAWETEDGKPILIHIDINGKAHYPPSEPKPKIVQTRPGHYDCHF